jgi:hypothetical protein
MDPKRESNLSNNKDLLHDYKQKICQHDRIIMEFMPVMLLLTLLKWQICQSG